MTDARLDQLRNQLADGFRDARPPSTADEIADDFEVPEVRDLVGTHWSEVPVQTLRRMNWDLHWFKTLGIRHYLPAFMLAAAGGEDETAETVIAYLSGDAGGPGELWPDEKRAVRTWLRYMSDVRDRPDAQRALAMGWEDPPISPLDEERVALFRRAREVFAPDRTARDATELAAAVTGALEQRLGSFRNHVSVTLPYDAAQRTPIVRSLSREQLAFMADLLEFGRRRWPDIHDEVSARFWREQAVTGAD